MTLEFVDTFINQKINSNENYVRFTFYELRVKYNLTEDETNKFLELAKNKFENMQYEVYFIGDTYEYQGATKEVEQNELLIAIKKI